MLFPRGSVLAVISGEDDQDEDFWLCRAAQNVYEDLSSFAVHWLEKADDGTYWRTAQPSRVEKESVLCSVKMHRAQNKASKVNKRIS